MSVASPIRRPAYTTTKGTAFSEWFEENRDDISEWYIATSEWLPEQHPEDFREFAACQFDIACELDAVLTDGLYEVQLAEADAEDEPWTK